MFSLKEMKIIESLSRTGSIKASSQELNLQQSNVSQVLINCESRIGLKFFDKKGFFFELNKVGRIVLPKIQGVLNSTSELSCICSSLKECLEGHVEVRGHSELLLPITKHIAAMSEKSVLSIAFKNINPEKVDDVLNGSDVVVDYLLPSDLSLVARKVGSLQLIPYASLSYIEHLNEHCAVSPMRPVEVLYYPMLKSSINHIDKLFGRHVVQKYSCDDFFAAHELAQNHAGILFSPESFIPSDSKLIPYPGEHSPFFVDVYIIHKVRMFQPFHVMYIADEIYRHLCYKFSMRR